MSPKVSILMPVFNAAPYLEDCLNSILSQGYANWELIAVNDHSTDGSDLLLADFAEKDARIHCLTNSSKGIIPALRMAYAHAKGDFIHRMDADDLMPAQKLEHMTAAIKKAGKGHLVTGKVKYFSSEGIGEGYEKYQNWLNELCDSHRHWIEIYKECVIASPCWMVHREDLEACGAFQEDRYPEDYDLVFRFYAQRLKVVSLPNVLHLWRDHAQRSSRIQEHYKENTFFDLKVHYFLKLEHKPYRTLIIWGAGRKGKLLARILKSKGMDYQWVSNNPLKEGKDIYGTLLEDYSKIVQKDNPQILITVAQKDAKIEINRFMQENNLTEHQDFYFFS